jgi:adenylate cyclase
MSTQPNELTLLSVRRMMEGVYPPTLCTVSSDGTPNVNYLSLAEYVDSQHLALSYQFFNRSRENMLATRRACLALDDPYTGAGVVVQIEYLRTETQGPTFERVRAKLDAIASHTGMEKIFCLRGADIFKVLELRRVPGRSELPAIQPRCDLAASSRLLSERMARCEDFADLLDVTLKGLQELQLIDHSMVWLLDAARGRLMLLASHGYEAGGTGAEILLGEGITGIAAREGVPIRVGHMMYMKTYGQAARGRAEELGLDALLNREIPLPGLPQPRSQLVVPLRARGRVLGVLFVESLHDQYFSYDDEDALTMLAGQLAGAMTLMQPPEVQASVSPPQAKPAALTGPALRMRRFPHDNTVFLDDQYLIRGVAGAILWRLSEEFAKSGRCEFTNRELRLAPELNLPDIQDNLEARLVLLQKRLAEHRAAIQIEKTGRGRFRFNVSRPLVMDSIAT